MIATRRQFIRGAAASAATLSPPGAFAQTLATAVTGDGPYYPDRLPLDTDNDLLILNDRLTPAVGEIAHFTGRLFAENGAPVRNAFIEIWQSDVNGSYIHSQGRNGKIDANFQGYGRFLTDSKGQYYFRTIKPVPYTLQGQFRAPHIHFAISNGGKRILTTQAHVKGHEANARDFVLNRVTDRRALDSVLADFKPMEGSKIGELVTNFDIVMGRTAG